MIWLRYVLCKYLLRVLTDIVLQLAGARFDSIRQADMEEAGIKGGHEELASTAVPKFQRFPQWKHSEITGSKLPTLSPEELKIRKKAGMSFSQNTVAHMLSMP